MAIDTKHPLYLKRIDDWILMEDANEGERQVKDKRETYLPATSGMKNDGMTTKQPGYLAYNAYLCRAVFPDLVGTALKGLIGIIHRKPATIELPPQLEEMEKNATIHGESLQALLRKITTHQLLKGRFGLLVEAPDGVPAGEALPFIVTYTAESMINWDTGVREQGKQQLEIVVLDETELERVDQFNWEAKKKHRILMRASEQFAEEDQSGVSEGVYIVGTLREEDGTEISAVQFMAPEIAGNQLERIPFVFVNSGDLIPDPDDPPLLGLGTLSMTIFRGEADYRQALFLQGQETLVIIGANPPAVEGEDIKVGAGAEINLPVGGDAKYVGVSADGLDQMRKALENDKETAISLGAQILDTIGSNAESGEAFRIRVSAKTTSIVDIVKTGAAALEQALKIAAE